MKREKRKTKRERKAGNTKPGGLAPADASARTLDLVASSMRKEAELTRKKGGGPPAFRVASGWKFGLSHGPVPTPTREVWERLGDSVMDKFGFKNKPSSYDEFLRMLEEAKAHGADQLLSREWIFSASLHPRGRSSTEADWRFLGQMAYAVGAPPDSLKTPFETTPPNDVHYWIWFEDPPMPLGMPPAEDRRGPN
jgi:hypothetical protein